MARNNKPKKRVLRDADRPPAIRVAPLTPRSVLSNKTPPAFFLSNNGLTDDAHDGQTDRIWKSEKTATGSMTAAMSS